MISELAPHLVVDDKVALMFWINPYPCTPTVTTTALRGATGQLDGSARRMPIKLMVELGAMTIVAPVSINGVSSFIVPST